MIIIESYDPNCISTKRIIISTNKGLVTIGESEPISYTRDKNGDLYLGTSQTVLRVSHKTAFQDLSRVIKPATFSLVVEDDGEISLKATIMGDSSIPFIPEVKDRTFQNVADIVSVRGHEGAIL